MMKLHLTELDSMIKDLTEIVSEAQEKKLKVISFKASRVGTKLIIIRDSIEITIKA